MERNTENVPDYLSLLRLDGGTFVVLGTGQGIGRQTAHALSQAGARIVCVDVDRARAEAVAAETRGVAIAADVTLRKDMERVFDEVGRVHGVVDIVGMPVGGPLADTSDDAYQRQMDIVFKHAFLGMQLGAKAIAASGGGAMVFVGSISGIGVTPGLALYGAAKAALHHLVAYTSYEWASRGVRINAVAPGTTRTPQLMTLFPEERWPAIGRDIPRGTAAIPAEIASVILFLCSDLAINITGQTLVADGGITRTVLMPSTTRNSSERSVEA